MSERKTTDKYMRPVRSFVLRQGRLTKGQDDALNRLWPQFGIERDTSVLDMDSLFESDAPITLEIGFGDGVSLATMAANAPDQNFIGIEVHRPGVGRILHLIEENNLTNLRVMDDDAVQIGCCYEVLHVKNDIVGLRNVAHHSDQGFDLFFAYDKIIGDMAFTFGFNIKSLCVQSSGA